MPSAITGSTTRSHLQGCSCSTRITRSTNRRRPLVQHALRRRFPRAARAFAHNRRPLGAARTDRRPRSQRRGMLLRALTHEFVISERNGWRFERNTVTFPAGEPVEFLDSRAW